MCVQKQIDRIIFDAENPPPEPFEKAVLPMFDPNGLVRGMVDQMYITTLAKQVLSDLIQQWPKQLRHHSMSMDLLYDEERNDFFHDFVELLAAKEQLVRRYNVTKLGYARGAKTVATFYRNKSFVFQHAQVQELKIDDHQTPVVHLLDKRVQSSYHRNSSSNKQMYLSHHTMKIVTRGALMASLRAKTEEVRAKKYKDDELEQMRQDRIKELEYQDKEFKLRIATKHNEEELQIALGF